MATAAHLPRLPQVFRPTNNIQAPWFSPFLSPRPRKASQTRYAPTAESSKTHVLGYTDASSKGIAVVIGGKWQRWTFNQKSNLLPRLPANKEIDVNWAELFAVYLGIYINVLAGYHACRIVLRSDNMAVVRMFQRFADIHPSLWCIPRNKRAQYHKEAYRVLLRRIGGLMAKHRLDVIVEWVSTNANLADGPSRGKQLSEETRLKYGANVPDDLDGVLVSV